MENNRNLILAMVLSVGVLLIWQTLVIAPREAERRQAIELAERREAAQRQARPGQPAQPGAVPGGVPGVTPINPSAQGGAVPDTGPVTGPLTGPNAIPGVSAGTALPTNRADAIAATRRVPFESARVRGSINLQGARIDDLALRNYRETVDPESPQIELLTPSGLPDSYFAEFGYMPNRAAGDLPGPDTVWSAPEGVTLAPGSPVTLAWTNDRGLAFERTIALDDGFMFTVTDRIANAASAPVSLVPYGRIARFGTPETQGIYVLHEGLIGYVGEEGLDEIDYDDIAEERGGAILRSNARGGWLGITDKYWATALVPSGPYSAAYRYNANVGARALPLYQTQVESAPLTVAAGATAETSTQLFAGAKKVEVIDAYEDAGVANFSYLIDWGWFPFLTKPMFQLIELFYGLVGNFGIAILLTTVAIKAVFFPLANKSYKSMANMKRVGPEMQAIRERFDGDRQKQQQAMMELYKKEKINPAAGCLPILVQIPVFFALYKVLYVTIDMRHAPFFGWIQDLSAPDPTSIFNLFGLLPYEVPLFLLIGVWPLIMGITMFVQMQMNPAPPDPTQAMIFKWMPVLFTFMLATFPAGLVIYWAWNNFLSIIQQGVIMKRQGAKIELWDNLKGMFGKKKAA